MCDQRQSSHMKLSFFYENGREWRFASPGELASKDNLLELINMSFLSYFPPKNTHISFVLHDSSRNRRTGLLNN